MYDSDGEKEERELVLGNRQLLGIFFVATLLCGVFFAMGYVVGGNSAKAGAPTSATATDGASAPTSDGKREEPDAPSVANPANDAETAPASSTAASGDISSPLPAAEPRVADNPAAVGAKPLTVPTPRVATPTTVPSAKPGAQAEPPTTAAVYISIPEKGTSYWQVAAVGRPTADVLVNSLRERALPAILAESSNPKLFRVLVGPYHSQPALADAKRKLTDFSFDNLIIQKY